MNHGFQATGFFVAFCILTLGCGARYEVAKKRFVDRIDEALGKMEVQREEISISVTAARTAAAGVGKAKARAEAQIELIDAKTLALEQRLPQYDQSLTKLRDHLQSEQPADIAGKTYSPDELREMARKVVQARKDMDNRVRGFKKAREDMQKVAAICSKQLETIESRLDKLQAKLTVLDAEMEAAKAMKRASAQMGDGNSTLAQNLDQLELKIAQLGADVKAELQTESINMAGGSSTKLMDDVDAFVQSAQSNNDVVAEINKLIGSRKK